MKSNNYYHGSGSASLVGVLSKESAGLKSFGQLFEEGKISYSGVLLDSGKSKRGVNHKCISAVPPETIKCAVDCALGYSNESWTPEIGEKDIQWLTNETLKLKSKKKLKNYEQMRLDVLKLGKRVQELRLDNWRTLSISEKELITDPFAIIYGFDFNGQVVSVFSDYPSEVGIPGTIPLEKLTIYVPQNKLKLTTDLSTCINENPLVLPFNELKKLQLLPRDAYDSIDRLINQTK